MHDFWSWRVLRDGREKLMASFRNGRNSSILLPRHRHSAIRLSLRHSLKVDISALHIRADQLHAEPVADVQAFKTVLQSSFNGRMQKTDPRAFVRCAGDDGIELLPDP